ncbi:MAG: hypothetical protein JWN76_26 [Chitinophagaceae bacterium]|nr:hypothetical protein [Chitinophagaceae bacterium]
MSTGPRELPKIEIGGVDFYIDLRLNEFRQVHNFMNRFSIDDLYETEKGFLLCFDPQTKNLFNGTMQEYDSRKDLLELELPMLKQMDPVGFKRMIDKWKEDNPLLVAMIENIPLVLRDKKDSKEKKHELLPKKRVRSGKRRKL